MKELKVVSKGLCVIVLILVLFSTCGFFNNKGRFITLNLTSPDGNQPVKINNNEVFFAGGWSGNHTQVYPAKIYKVKEKKLISLGVTMNYPRSNYGAIKYDNEHILVVGGFCISDDGKSTKDCSHIAEIYNIKHNRFTRISDTNLSYRYDVQPILLQDGRVFVYSRNQFEIFDPEQNKFLQISKPKFKYSVNNKDVYTNNFYVRSKAILLNENEVLIAGDLPKTPTIKMEILNLNTGLSKDVPIDNGFIPDSSVKIDDGSILSFGLGKDCTKINKFDPKTKKIISMPNSKKPLKGRAILLEDGTILVGYGTIKGGNILFPGTALVYAIYDYKNNKIYNYKTSHNDFYGPHFIQLDRSLLIIGYKDDFIETKSMLYKY